MYALCVCVVVTTKMGLIQQIEEITAMKDELVTEVHHMYIFISLCSLLCVYLLCTD